MVVRGDDGLDEITLCSETSVVELKNGEIFEYSITPEQFGFKRALHSDIEGGTPEENAKTLIRTLKGEEQGAKFDIVVFNAMFALYAADGAKSPDEAKKMVLEAINSGKAYKFYEEFIKAQA